MDKRKNGENSNNSGSRVVVTILVLALLMVTGVLPAVIELVLGIAFGIVGLVLGLVGGLIGLVMGLFGAAIGLIFGLLPIVVTVGIVVLIVKAINGDTGKRKNDDIDFV